MQEATLEDDFRWLERHFRRNPAPARDDVADYERLFGGVRVIVRHWDCDGRLFRYCVAFPDGAVRISGCTDAEDLGRAAFRPLPEVLVEELSSLLSMDAEALSAASSGLRGLTEAAPSLS